MAALVLFASLGGYGSVAAQQIDSTATLRSAPDSVRTADMRPGFFTDSTGIPLSVGRPARRAALDLVSLLSDQTGFLAYSFGTPGWPSSISPFGLDPNLVELRFAGVLLEDLITGRPRFDLLPYAFIDQIRVDKAPNSRPFAVHAVAGMFQANEPITDLRYSSSNTGLQAIDAIHAQSRVVSLIGPGDRLGLVFAYAGAAADGEYPGSRLQRARQLLARIRVEHTSWSLELLELYNRRKIGAHGGVEPRPGQPYSSIYQHLGASVENPEAQRLTIRNDLSLKFRTVALEFPLTVTGFWTTQTLRYRVNTDTVTARIHRLGISVKQAFRFGIHGLRLNAQAWIDQYRSGDAFVHGSESERAVSEFIVSGTTAWRSLKADAAVGLHSDAGHAFTSASTNVTFGALSLSASTTGIRSAWIAETGFGDNVLPLAEHSSSRISRLFITANHALGALGLHATAFINSVSDATAWQFDTSIQRAQAVVIPGNVRRLGVAVEISFRADEEAGMYGMVRPTLLKISTSDNSEIALAAQSAAPEFWISGRIGIRALLFKSDLDLDLSVRAFYWDTMIGRRLDPQTGLLMLPVTAATEVASSATVDVVVEAGVRTATIFLAYENIFSGTNALVGNLLIPDYPLPAKRFRFGVFWPISN